MLDLHSFLGQASGFRNFFELINSSKDMLLLQGAVTLLCSNEPHQL